MRNKIFKIIRIRGVKTALEIIFIMVIFLLVKSYMQRDLVNGIAPLIQGKSLDGHPVSLNDYRGDTVLVYFWATWCPVCKIQKESIADISNDYNVLTVAMNSGSPKEIKEYLDENNLRLKVLVDESGTIAEKYGVSGVPTAFIVNPKGNIAFTEVGYTTEWGLRFRLWLAGN